MDTLKLEFNDRNDSILYLKYDSIDNIAIKRACHDCSWYIVITVYPEDPGFSHIFLYNTEQDRDIDYEYAIKQLDILMNINREEF